MNIFKSRTKEISFPMTNGGLDKISVFLGLIAIAFSAGAAIAIGQFGALVLLVVPAVIFFVVVFVQPDYGLSFFIFITVTQVSNVAIEFYDAPSIAQPLAGLLMAVILLRIALYQELPLYWGRITPVLVMYVVALFLSMVNAADFKICSVAFI